MGPTSAPSGVSSKTGLPGFVPPALEKDPAIARSGSPQPQRSQSRSLLSGEHSQSRSVVAKENSFGSSLRSSLRQALPPRIPRTHGGPTAAAAEKEQQEQMQNATSLALLQEYFLVQPGVPVDPRNGMDMRTLYPAQDPSYLLPHPSTTYETAEKAARPYYEGGLLDKRRHGFGRCTFSNAFFKYGGNWRGGRMHGEGRLELGDGGFYEGEFAHGEICGSGMRQWCAPRPTHPLLEPRPFSACTLWP